MCNAAQGELHRDQYGVGGFVGCSPTFSVKDIIKHEMVKTESLSQQVADLHNLLPKLRRGLNF